MPVILTSWKINLSLAIRVVTIAELVGAVSGVGYGLVMAQELFSVADVFAWTLVLVVILFLAEAVLTMRRGAHAAVADMRTDAADIEVSGLRKLFQQTITGDQVVAIDRLDFRIRSGEMVAIVGQTGCGKSTFLNLLIGLDRPSEGRITIGGRAPYDDFDHFRGMLATVFQQDRLLPWRSAIDNVRLPLELLRLRSARADRTRHRLARSPRPEGHSRGPIRTSFPAACASASRWRGLSSSSRCCCSPMKPSATSTR